MHLLCPSLLLIFLTGTPAQTKTRHSLAAAHPTLATAQDVPQATFGLREWAREVVQTIPLTTDHTIKMNNVHMDNGGLVLIRLPPFKGVA